MKVVKHFIHLIFIGLLFAATSCTDVVEEPVLCYNLIIEQGGEEIVLKEPFTVVAGQTIEFTNCGLADFYSFFPGTPLNSWSEYKDQNDLSIKGLDTNGGDISYAYEIPGTYTATMVLTNRQVSDPTNSKQLTKDFVITVTPIVEE